MLKRIIGDALGMQYLTCRRCGNQFLKRTVDAPSTSRQEQRAS
jgi:predicted Zn-ribbon and HTH transcriptional regulator